MNNSQKNTQKGVIKYIIIIVAALILIAYFRTNIQNFLNSPGVKDALIIAIGWLQTGLAWIISKLGWTSSQIK